MNVAPGICLDVKLGPTDKGCMASSVTAPCLDV